jgi:hypothetical protein
MAKLFCAFGSIVSELMAGLSAAFMGSSTSIMQPAGIMSAAIAARRMR